MKQRRIYTPPQTALLDSESPELLANSNINYGNTAAPVPYEQGTNFDNNIHDFEEGDGITFDFEE